jgi:hypothetical protein
MHSPVLVEPVRPRLKLALVALLALLSVGALVAARPPLDGDAWVRGVDLAFVTAWLVALAASAWLFLATALCVVTLGLDRPALARRLAPVLPAGVRRLVDIALAGSIAGSIVAFPALPALSAHAAPAPAPALVLADQPPTDEPVVRAPAAPIPAPAPTRPATTDHVVVRPGDNLWLIAGTTLTRTTGSQPSEHEIARYWHAVISANRSTLRSGDPSLIFPGEIVSLPPPSATS